MLQFKEKAEKNELEQIRNELLRILDKAKRDQQTVAIRTF